MTRIRNEEAYQKALNEGHSAAWDQDWGKAADCYKRAVQAAPDEPKALTSLGLSLYQLGHYQEALQCYQQAARLAPADPLPLEKVAQIAERLGDIPAAVEAAMSSAESYLRQHDIDKAIENWGRVTALQPEQATAHGRLATAYERLGKKQEAVGEYLAVASLLQRAGTPDKAQEIVGKAAMLVPDSREVKQALSQLKMGQMLPAPARTKGGTAPLRMAKIRQMTEPVQSAPAPQLDPVAEATQKALTKLAEILFDYSPDSPSSQQRQGITAIIKGTGQLSMQHAETTKVVLHLGQAIDAQTKGQYAAAGDELERALDAGFEHAALHFSLGAVRLKAERQESAIRHLARSVKHRDYGMASRLLLGEILFKKGLYKDASLEYLDALKLADAMTVPEGHADEIREAYEPFIEAQQSQKDANVCRQLCDNVRGLLMRSDWRDQVQASREQSGHGSDFAPLAEMMLAAQSLGVVEAMARINQLAKAGSLRSAMDEAYNALQRAPNYLPLHSLMAELLIQDGRTPDAIAKMAVIARAYSVRGEVAQAARLWRRIIQLSPIDMAARSNLIDLLRDRGQVEEALREYLELADVYYRLAELDMARRTFTTALHFVQQSNADRSWNVNILQRMADIDMQRLDWHQALRVHEQIRTLRPDDQAARRQLVELHTRMGQPDQATAELDGYLTYLESSGHLAEAVPFLEDLVREHPEQSVFLRALAAQLHRSGHTREAVEQLDGLGEKLLQAGRKQEALEVITQIVGMNPPNAADYRKLLSQIGI
ncbi:MAG TPA: tetratricopeptide repeat protein [Anaerolineales bacterium]